MKIKCNVKKETFTLKGLSYVELALIFDLVCHVRLGTGSPASQAASNIQQGFDDCELLLEDPLPKIDISVNIDTDEMRLTIDCPTLDVI